MDLKDFSEMPPNVQALYIKFTSEDGMLVARVVDRSGDTELLGSLALVSMENSPTVHKLFEELMVAALDSLVKRIDPGAVRAYSPAEPESKFLPHCWIRKRFA